VGAAAARVFAKTAPDPLAVAKPATAIAARAIVTERRPSNIMRVSYIPRWSRPGRPSLVEFSGNHTTFSSNLDNTTCSLRSAMRGKV
jgi:hypothetical protein